MPDAPAEQRAKALLSRGCVKEQAGDTEGAIADYTAVLGMRDAPAEQEAQAVRGSANLSRRIIEWCQLSGAVIESRRVLEVFISPAAPSPQQRAANLIFTAASASGFGDTAGAMADWTEVVKMPDAPADVKTQALLMRGVAKVRSGDTEGAIADYTTVVEMPGAPAEQKAKAMFNRGWVNKEAGDKEGAMADWKAVIEMPDAPAKLKARAAAALRDAQTDSDKSGATGE